MFFEIEKTFTFEAGHVLVHHDGHCSSPHGHSYTACIKLRAPSLIDSGCKKNMVIDFGDIKTAVAPMLRDYLDHHWLNDTLKTDSPTVEFIAKWIFDHIKPKLPTLYAVTVHETATSKATYCLASPI